jgi:hypothetical protein
MKTCKNLTAILLSVCAAASCGKSPKKQDSGQQPQTQPTPETNDEPLKKVTNTSYPFALPAGVSTCEDLKRRVLDKTWTFNLTFKNFKDQDQEETASFVSDWVYCNAAEDRLIIIAEGVESTKFNIAYYVTFADGAGLLRYDLDNCGSHAPDTMLNKIPSEERPKNDYERYQVIRTTNDNFCVPAVGKLADQLVSALSL